MTKSARHPACDSYRVALQQTLWQQVHVSQTGVVLKVIIATQVIVIIFLIIIVIVFCMSTKCELNCRKDSGGVVYGCGSTEH